jgi:hypothetical protein
MTESSGGIGEARDLLFLGGEVPDRVEHQIDEAV